MTDQILFAVKFQKLNLSKNISQVSELIYVLFILTNNKYYNQVYQNEYEHNVIHFKER